MYRHYTAARHTKFEEDLFIRYMNRYCPQRLNSTSLQILTGVYRSCIKTTLSKYYPTPRISKEYVFRLLESCWLWCQRIWGQPHGLVPSCSPYDCLGHNQGCEIFTGPLGLLKIHRRLQDWGSLGLVNGFHFTRAHRHTDTHRHTHTHTHIFIPNYVVIITSIKAWK